MKKRHWALVVFMIVLAVLGAAGFYNYQDISDKISRQDDPKMAEFATQISNYLYDKQAFDSAQFTIQQALTYCQKVKDTSMILYFYNYQADAYILQKKQEQFLTHKKKLIPYFECNTEQKFYCYKHLAVAHLAQRELDSAQKYFLLSLEIEKSFRGDSCELGGIYTELAQYYDMIGNYHSASIYYQKSLPACKADTDATTSILLTYAHNCFLQNNYQLAEKYWNEALYLASFQKRKNILMDTYNSLVYYYLYSPQTNIDSANYYLNLEKQILKSGAPLPTSTIGRCYKYLAELKYHQKNYQQALDTLLLAMPLRKNRYDDMAANYVLLTKIYNQLHQKKGVLSAINAGLSCCTANSWETVLLSENPPVSQIVCIKEAITLWKLKLAFFQQQNQYNQALAVVFKLDSLVDKIRVESLSENNQLFWTSELANLYQEGIKIAYLLGEDYYQTVFYFTEKSKNFVLYTTLKSNHYEKNIPNISPLIAEKNRLQQQLFYLHKKLNTEFANKKRLQAELTTTKIALLNKQALIKAKYPKYDKLIANLGVETISGVQSQLSDQEVVIEYARLDNFALAFVICKTDFKVLRLENTNDSLLYQFKNYLESPAISLTKYQPLAYQLYQTWIQPIEKYAPQPHWLIIRDGLLNYLPFETFVTNNTATDFKTLTYWLHQKAISYHYSLTLWKYLQETVVIKQNNDNFFLTLIDNYSGDRHLLPLSSSEKLGNVIEQNITNGTTSYQTKKTQFMSYFTPQKKHYYPLICLYTHALANENQPDSSWIAFYDANIYVSEILQLNLSTDLLILGSCQSGTGKLYKGEGVISLSRAFIYSGVKNILSMQWDMDVEAGNEILSNTIINLSQNQSKNIALQNAKKQYLTQHTLNLQPYFWAAPYLIGDTQSIVFEGVNPKPKISYPYLFFIFVSILLSYLLYFLRKKHKKDKL